MGLASAETRNPVIGLVGEGDKDACNSDLPVGNLIHTINSAMIIHAHADRYRGRQ